MTAGTLAAIAAAEDEARAVVENCGKFSRRSSDRDRRWAEDRLRLCARDRAVLERHHAPPPDRDLCYGCMRPYPCPDTRAVIDYWQGETP